MSELHGALNPAELERLGLDAAQVLDFSSNCLPGLAHPRVREAVRTAAIEPYPSPDAAPLRLRLSACHRVSLDAVVAGAGAAQLIFASVQAYSREGDRVLVVSPSFGEYADAAVALRRRVERVHVAPDDTPDLGAVFRAVQQFKPALVFVCQPNNPTGRLWPEAQLVRLMQVCLDNESLLVVDHAYRTFVDPSQRFRSIEGAINLYSLTKDFALAGVRLGYAVLPVYRAAALNAVLPPWSVSQPAIAAGLAALEPEVIDATDRAIVAVRESAASLWEALRARGVVVLPTDTHFALLERPGASAFRQRLLERASVQIRSAASFGLPDHVRVASKGVAADAKLLQAWDRFGAESESEL